MHCSQEQQGIRPGATCPAKRSWCGDEIFLVLLSTCDHQSPQRVECKAQSSTDFECHYAAAQSSCSLYLRAEGLHSSSQRGEEQGCCGTHAVPHHHDALVLPGHLAQPVEVVIKALIAT